jgi:hypothetical protein
MKSDKRQFLLNRFLSLGSGWPILVWRVWLRKTLPLCIQAAFVQRAADLVDVLVTTQITNDLPGDGGLIAIAECIVEESTRVFSSVTSHGPVFVQSIVVNYNGDYVGLSSLKVW